MKAIWYRVTDHCEDSYYDLAVAVHMELTDDFDARRIAEKCADDYHSNHDG